MNQDANKTTDGNPMRDGAEVVRDHSLRPGDVEVAPGIVVNELRRHGKPCFVGTRLTVEEVLERLRWGETPDQIIHSWPNLTHEDIEHAIAYGTPGGRRRRRIARLARAAAAAQHPEDETPE